MFKVEKTDGDTDNASNEVTTYHITWPVTPIDKTFAIRVRKLVDKSRSYGSTLLKSVEQLVKSESKAGYPVPLAVALNMQHSYTKAKIIRNYYSITPKIPKIAADYNQMNIMELSRKYDFSPLLLLKHVWLHRGVDSTVVANAINGITPNSPALTAYDRQQYKIAYSEDLENRENRDDAAKFANIAENKFVEYFRSLGINLKSENDLINEQMASSGRAVLTPDILFLDKVYINGTLCKWLDFKNYSCLDVAFLLKNNIRQAEKYNKEWSSGALCYRHGFLSDIKIPSTLLLDVSNLPISWQF